MQNIRLWWGGDESDTENDGADSVGGCDDGGRDDDGGDRRRDGN